MPQVDFDKVFARIKQVTGVKNQTELARLMNCGDMCVSSAKKRKAIPARWLIKLLQTHSVNPDWIITGKGPCYLMPDLTHKEPIMYDQDFKFSLHLKSETDSPIASIDVDCRGSINEHGLERLSFAILGALKTVYKKYFLTEQDFATMLARFVIEERSKANSNFQKLVDQLLSSSSSDEPKQ